MRDAIVISGWTWEARNVPERLALALAGTGARVLYCENPVSVLRRPFGEISEVASRVFRCRPAFLSHRFNQFPRLAHVQAMVLEKQISRAARQLALRNPVFFYPHGRYALLLAAAMKRRGSTLVHICMDYELRDQIEHVQISDLTLAIPQAAFAELRKSFGPKIRKLPQFAAPADPDHDMSEPNELACSASQSVPKPWLVYLGDVEGRVDLGLLERVLKQHPEWHFISFGNKDPLSLPNSHILPWGSSQSWNHFLSKGAIGFIPYDCRDEKNMHCVPLKLFDYFARGLPVVSTPIAYVLDYPDLVYIGGSAEELATAIGQAVREPEDNSCSAKRKSIAAEHSIENLSRVLAPLLADGEL